MAALKLRSALQYNRYPQRSTNKTVTVFHSAFGDLDLSRWPRIANDPLQAWDAADEYLLQHLFEHPQFNTEHPPAVLIINDSQGALSCALHHCHPVNWSDSINSQTAAVENAKSNPRRGTLSFLKSTDDPAGKFDFILVKIPKTNALLEHQLIQLSPSIKRNTVFIAAGMVKHMQRSAFQAIEKFVGPVTTSLAVKKARLIFSEPIDHPRQITSPYPSRYEDKETGLTLVNHANVFSRDHLDIGSRFLMSQMEKIPAAHKVVDLACGNGVLGISYQKTNQDAEMLYTDESYMAVASAQINHAKCLPNSKQQPQFITQNGLANVADDSVDLVLCNPPFHQQHAIGEGIAAQLFGDAKRCLKRGGQLWIVANHHLGYQDRLNRLFGQCSAVQRNRKFVVLQSIKRG